MKKYTEYRNGEILQYRGIKLIALPVIGKVLDGCNNCYCLHHLDLCAYNGNPITGYCCNKDRNTGDDIYFKEAE